MLKQATQLITFSSLFISSFSYAALREELSTKLVLKQNIPAYSEVQMSTLPSVLTEKCAVKNQARTSVPEPLNFDIDVSGYTLPREGSLFSRYKIVSDLLPGDKVTETSVALFSGDLFNIEGGPFGISLALNCRTGQLSYQAYASGTREASAESAYYAGAQKFNFTTEVEPKTVINEETQEREIKITNYLVVDLKDVPFILDKGFLEEIPGLDKDTLNSLVNGWNQVNIQLKLALEKGQDTPTKKAEYLPIGKLYIQSLSGKDLLITPLIGLEFTELFNSGTLDLEKGGYTEQKGDVKEFAAAFKAVKASIHDEYAKLFLSKDILGLDFSKDKAAPQLVPASEIYKMLHEQK